MISPANTFIAFLDFFIISIILMICVLFASYYKKVLDGKTVSIIDYGETCEPGLGDLDVIPEKYCELPTGENVLCYRPSINSSLVFELSRDPVYFRSVCSRACGGLNSKGECDEKSPEFNFCISLLEPNEKCNNSAKPLGRLDQTNNVYYAGRILFNTNPEVID